MNDETTTGGSGQQEHTKAGAPTDTAMEGSVQAPEPEGPKHAVRIERWTETFTAIMLGIVAIATAWSGYQSARWGGVQGEQTAKAAALRTESTRASILGGQTTQIDLALGLQWINAYAAGDAELENFYYERFRPEFRQAVDAWLQAQSGSWRPRLYRRFQVWEISASIRGN